jgi:hypothetical protein
LRILNIITLVFVSFFDCYITFEVEMEEQFETANADDTSVSVVRNENGSSLGV